MLTFGPASDAKYPGQGFEITGISGTFSDANLGIVDAPITSLVASSPAPPLDVPPNELAPHDFSHFAVATVCRPESRGFITYDNLFWPEGAPPTATAFDGAGGISGYLRADVRHRRAAGSSICSTMALAPSWRELRRLRRRRRYSETQLDRVAAGVTATAPEPSTWAMMILGFAGLGFAGYRKARKSGPVAA